MRKKKLLCLTLAIIMLFVLSSTVFAQNIETRYTGVGNLYAELSINSFGKSTSTAYISLYPGYTADVTVDLCESSGISWPSVKDWSFSAIGSTERTYSWYVTSGTNYKVVVTVNVYNEYAAAETFGIPCQFPADKTKTAIRMPVELANQFHGYASVHRTCAS